MREVSGSSSRKSMGGLGGQSRGGTCRRCGRPQLLGVSLIFFLNLVFESVGVGLEHLRNRLPSSPAVLAAFALDPLPDICRTILQLHAISFAARQILHRV